MSHSVCVVCLPPTLTEKVEEKLAQALAPFDENARDEPYEDWESGTADSHWSVKHLREEGKLPAGALTWHQVAQANNADIDDPKEGIQVTQDGLSAFTWSTYPRDVPSEDGLGITAGARWDWWSIGGRWTGYFEVNEYALGKSELIYGRPGLMTSPNSDPLRCDGGPRWMLDFGRHRDREARDATDEWDTFNAIAKQYPNTKGWSHFRDLINEKKVSPDKARELYREQPGVIAVRGTFGASLDCPYDQYAVSRDEYEKRARRNAVLGYALLDLNGVWREPGKMGWWGMSSESDEQMAAYKDMANEYLDNLSGDAIVIAVDVHI